MSAPTRLGLVTLHTLLRKALKIITKFNTKMQEWLTSSDYAKIVALVECINDVLTNVPQYPQDPPT